MNLPSLNDEEARMAAFPVARNKIFLAHAAVTALPQVVSQAVADFSRRASERDLDFAELTRDLHRTRSLAARWIGARADEIALLGPTSLGLSLFANGLPWKEGDEVVCYRDDYPANVYPWLDLQRLGVVIRYLEPKEPGAITPELVEAALTPRTRLVALASAHFLTGYRIDVDAIGRMLGERGVLFSLDAIQTIGAFSLSVEHVDFLSADAHKWMLGPMAIGIVYVKKKHFGLLRPTLLGAWNVLSPEFITQEEIRFPDSAMRYEPGVLNVAGIYGMHAGLELLETYGIGNVSARLLAQKAHLVNALRPLGFEIYGPVEGPNASGATTFGHPKADMKALFAHLEQHDVVASLRGNRQGRFFIRLSPHFYNTTAELDRVVELLEEGLGTL
ncbi:MAG TPA: aminotransferase class V-fold PLP-dependent enzyme [Chthoniobacteraceae bacterium]|nr:aminotransferase class V-fold PLP-dependent enzyme [Chthoniobacteraceae bacterium]